MLVQFVDLFSVPEISLLCNVAEYFERNQIDYNPELLYADVKVTYFVIFRVTNIFSDFNNCGVLFLEIKL